MNLERHVNIFIIYHNQYYGSSNSVSLMDKDGQDERNAYDSIQFYITLCDWVDKYMTEFLIK